MKFFFPRQSVFFDLLEDAYKCLQEMTALFEQFAKDFKDFEGYHKRAREIEHRADTKTHAIIDKLNKTFITPFEREDIYMLAHEIDDIVDLIENIISSVYLYRLEKKPDTLDKFAVLINKAAIHLGEMSECMRHQKHNQRLMSLKIKIHELEDAGDLLFAQAISRLFTEETDPVSLLKSKDIIEAAEDILDKCQKLSDIIEGIIVKSV